MRCHASFDPDQTPWHISEPRRDPAAGNLLPQNYCPLVVEADQMKGVFACIDANGVSDCSGCLMGHGEVLLVLLSPRSFSERFGAGAPPGHPILAHRVPGWLAPVVSRFWVVATQTAHPFGVRSHFGLKFARDSINTAA